jgi:hypothetical protein
MCTDIVVLRFAHLHFVLQDFGHGSDTLSVPIHCDRIYIFGKQVVIFLLFEVTLVVHQVVGGVQILGLQIFAGIFLCQLYIFDVYCSFSVFVALIQSVEYRNA